MKPLKKAFAKAAIYSAIFFAGWFANTPEKADQWIPSGRDKNIKDNIFIVYKDNMPENVKVTISANLTEEPYKGTGDIHTYVSSSVPAIIIEPK